jgi:hypothetical protein
MHLKQIDRQDNFKVGRHSDDAGLELEHHLDSKNAKFQKF